MVSVVLDNGKDIYCSMPIVMQKSMVHTVHGSKHHNHDGPHDVCLHL